MKKGLLLLLLIGVLLTAAACGNGDASENSGSLVSPDFVYVPTYTSFDGDIEDINNVVFYGDKLFFSSYGKIGTKEPDPADLEANDGVVEDWMTEVYGISLYKVDLDGKNLTKLEGYQPMALPEGLDGDTSINSFFMDGEGNLWTNEYVYGYGSPNEDDGSWQRGDEYFYLRKLDQQGNELAVIDLTDILGARNRSEDEWFYINSVGADNSGHIYVSIEAEEQKIYALDASTGEIAFQLSPDSWVNRMVRMADGTVAMDVYDETKGGEVLKTIDPATKDFGKTYKLPLYINNIYGGGGEYAAYCSDSSYLYGIKADGDTYEALLNWIDSDINVNEVRALIPLEDGRVVCLTSNGDTNEDGEYITATNLITLTKTPASEVPKKTVLTMATMWMDGSLRSEIIKFNRTNPDYRIQVVDYSEYNSEEDYQAGLTKLNTEIITGNVPDILDVDSLPVQRYISKGLLEDLYPYLDSDKELSRDSLVPEALKAMEVDGHLYQASPGFSVTTLIGDSRIVGDKPGWTFDQMKQALAAHPEASAFSPYITRDVILYYSFFMNQDQYLDWKTGECHFDSPDFISLLEFAASLPEEYDWENEDWVDETQLFREGKLLLAPNSIYSLSDLNYQETQYGGHITYIGFPTTHGCGSSLTTDLSLSISSASKNKEAAWSFVRTVFTKEYQKNVWSIPMSQARFDEVKEEAMTEDTYTDEDGNDVIMPKYTMGTENGEEIKVYALTQAQVDRFLELLSLVDSSNNNMDQNILNIVQEEAAPFFAGEKTAEETANIIQSRATIYINEQR